MSSLRSLHLSTSYAKHLLPQSFIATSIASCGTSRSFCSSSSASLSQQSTSQWSKSSMFGTVAAAGAVAGIAYWYSQSYSQQVGHSTHEPGLSIPSESSGNVICDAFGTLMSPFKEVKNRISTMFEDVFKDFAEPSSEVLLPMAAPDAFGNVPRTLVLDVEGTLMYNSWERGIGWRAVKRPGVDLFLTRMFQAGYEIVTFSSGHQATLEPIINRLDGHRVIAHRLYRDATLYKNGIHTKDLSRLNRQLSKVIIVDDQPECFNDFRENAIQISPFKGDPNDTELLKLIPLLESMITDDVNDVREVIRQFPGENVGERFIQSRVARARKLQAEAGQLSPSSSSSKPSWAARFGFGSK